MNDWYMVTLVGRDRAGIVAAVSQALYAAGGHLGEASMARLGGNFSMMLMVRHADGQEALSEVLNPVAEELHLRLHVDAIEGELHHHLDPDVRISVYGADRAGIVATVTAALAEAGLHILDLESDVAGTAERPIYVMHIEGHAQQGVDALRQALDRVADGMDVHLEPIDTMLG